MDPYQAFLLKTSYYCYVTITLYHSSIRQQSFYSSPEVAVETLWRAYLSRWHLNSYTVAVKQRLELQSSGTRLGRMSKKVPHMGGSWCEYLLGTQWLWLVEWLHMTFWHGSLRCLHMVAGFPQNKYPDQPGRNDKAVSELCHRHFSEAMQHYFYCILFFISELLGLLR